MQVSSASPSLDNIATLASPPTPNTGLIQENIALKNCLLDLNAQLLALKAESKSNKSLLKNLKAINVSVSEENAIRTKDNNALKAKLSDMEKKMDNLTSQLNAANTNINRGRKVYTSLQLRAAETEKSLKEQLAEKELEIASMRSQIDSQQLEFSNEKHQLINYQNKLEGKTSDLSRELLQANEHIIELEHAKSALENDVLRMADKCEGISEFVNLEMETAYESLHQKLEISLREADHFRRELMEKQNENDQLLALMLREGLQMPHIRPLQSSSSPQTIPIFIEDG